MKKSNSNVHRKCEHFLVLISRQVLIIYLLVVLIYYIRIVERIVEKRSCKQILALESREIIRYSLLFHFDNCGIIIEFLLLSCIISSYDKLNLGIHF